MNPVAEITLIAFCIFAIIAMMAAETHLGWIKMHLSDIAGELKKIRELYESSRETFR